jgi:hypothetical protein
MAVAFVDITDFVGRPYSPNVFLLDNLQLHNNSCFCGACRMRHSEGINAHRRTRDELRNHFIRTIPLTRESRSDAVFEITLKQITMGYVYRKKCLENTGYTYFKTWAKNQPEYQRISKGTYQEKREFNFHCMDVNDAAYCFENWERIVGNLTDERMKSIDARNFSVRYFRESASIDWCLTYNEKVRPKGKCRGDPPFSNAKVDDIFNHIISTGILEDIEHEPRLAASIGEQLQRKLTRYCRQRANPY